MTENEVEKFYYKNIEVTDKEFEDMGIPKYLNRTDSNLENYIEQKIRNGIYDAEAFAWKAGKAGWKNEQFVYVSPLPNKWVNGNGGEIKKFKDDVVFSKKEFEEYLENNKVNTLNKIDDSPECRKNLYLMINEKYELYNYGVVNIIKWLLKNVFSSEIHKDNDMFFISRVLDQALWGIRSCNKAL